VLVSFYRGVLIALAISVPMWAAAGGLVLVVARVA
jgi:formate-dependent nitrite reductase membrane component NrfD